jgi:hypothetical protein
MWRNKKDKILLRGKLDQLKYLRGVSRTKGQSLEGYLDIGYTSSNIFGLFLLFNTIPI